MLYVSHNTKVILLMITDGKKWHYLVVKSLSALLKGITTNHNEDFYCLNIIHSNSTRDGLKKHENMCKDHDYCYVEMPDKDNNILKCNHGEKSMKVSFITYGDMESLLEKISTCHNNPDESSTTKISKHTPSVYSLFTNCSFDNTKRRFNYYRGQDCIKRFSKDLKKHAAKIINSEKK